MNSKTFWIFLFIYTIFVQHVYSGDYLNYADFYQIGGILDDDASEIVVRENDLYVVGTTSDPLYASTNTNGSDIFIARYYRNMTFIIGTQLGTNFTFDVGYGLAVSRETPVFVYVSFVYNNTPGIARYTENLQSVWFRTWGDPASEGMIFRLVFDEIDSLLWGIGSTKQNFSTFGAYNNGGFDAWLIQVDPETGDATDMSLFGTPDDEYFWGVSIVDGNSSSLPPDRLFMVGYSIHRTSQTKNSLGFVSQYDIYGNLVHMNWITSSEDDVYVTDIKVLPEGKLLCIGDFSGTLSLNGQSYGQNEDGSLFVAALNLLNISAPPFWTTQFNSVGTQSIAVDVKDDYAVILARQDANGFFEGVGTIGLWDILLVLVNTTQGQLISASLFGTQVDDTPNAVSIYSESEVWIAGVTDGALGVRSEGKSDFFIGKVFPKSDKKKGLSTAAVLAIGLLVPCGCGAILGGAIFYTIYRRKTKNMQKPSNDRVSTDYEQMAVIGQTSSEHLQSSVSLPTESNVAIPEIPNSDEDIKKAKQQSLQNDWVINFSEIKMEKKIGQGAFGEVFKGKWRGIHVAVKQMAVIEDRVKVQDFFSEAQIMKQLQPHSNITQLLGVCSSPICIVTEFVANGSLLSWLQSDRPMNDSIKMEIIKGTAAGMLHLHRQGVIHRDLAARNILLDKTLSPKVADFGMSRVALDNATNKTEASVGPIKWMAPEALLQRTYNQKTDVWSFGVVIFEILTRESPYKDYNLMQIGASVGVGKLSLIPYLEPRENEFPKQAMDIFKLCLQFDSKERPTFEQIVEWLDSDNAVL